jgi:branched-chain amino acid transport system permease protein
MLLGLLAGTLTGLLAERLVIRPLFYAPRSTLLVATAGIALTLATLEALLFGIDVIHNLPSIGGPSRFAFFGSVNSAAAYHYGWTQVTTVLALVAVAVAAVVFFRTRYGAAILAVSQEPFAAGAVGIDVGRISALTWGLAGFIGAAAALVYFAGGAFIPGGMSGFYVGVSPLISAFTAAVIGGMTSLPGAFAGGLALGIVEQVGGNYMPASVPGGEAVVTATLLLVVLLVRPTGLLGRET